MSCEHPGCRCVETTVQRGNQKFCSLRCADMTLSGSPEPICVCGHPECSPA